MLVIDSPRAKGILATGWLCFAIPNATLMYLLPGEETIPYHLIWASFAFLYGLAHWSRRTTWATFSAITVVTAIPLIDHAGEAIIGWAECSEIVLMGVIAGLLVWHVNRQQTAQRNLAAVRETERVRAHNRELATRFGSHEVRTRLTIARGFTEMIRDNTRDDRTESDAGLVLVELDKASALTMNLMTLVRVDALPKVQAVDLDELIDSVVRRWVVRVDRMWMGTTTVGSILGDAERIEAALDCLIENAVKFTLPGDSISIDARTEARDVVICIEDSGTGIPPDDLQHVTELFHTSSNAGRQAGSGLGLAIVRAIVEARGGTLDISSTLGVGTRVTIRMSGDTPAALPGRAVAARATFQSVSSPQVAVGVDS